MLTYTGLRDAESGKSVNVLGKMMTVMMNVSIIKLYFTVMHQTKHHLHGRCTVCEPVFSCVNV